MAREHDTSERRERFPSEPSPFASETGAAALISRSGPPDQWPAPFSQPSSFIYAPRDRHTHDYGVQLEAEMHQMRLDGLERRLRQQYGDVLGAQISDDRDSLTNADLAKWQVFGA